MNEMSRRRFVGAIAALGGGAAVGTRVALAGTTDGLAFKSAIELADLVRSGKISSVELTQFYIDRIERFDEKINAVVVRDFERALAAAKAADQALASGNVSGPLHGLPMTIKESFDIAGLPSSWGIPPFRDNIAKRDSHVVEQFKAAGAHFLGKTNVPLALGDWQSYNDIYGITGNPWDLTRTPGGSSGGSAAALAAGMTALESGSDIGGSIRNPAHYCGVYGHKPTWGVVPGRGHALPGLEAEPDLAVVGPMARSAEDLALGLELTAAPSRLNGPGWDLALPAPRAKSLKDYRVAVWATDQMSESSEAVRNRVATLAENLARLGASVSDSARPAFSAKQAHETYTALLNAFLAAVGAEADYEEAQARAAKYKKDDASWEAFEARTQVLSHREWMNYHNVRTRMRRQWQDFFEDWDIVLCPIGISTAFPHDHSPQYARQLLVDGKKVPYWDQLFWAGLANMPYLPSTVFPTGPAEDGLPVGLQAIGAEYQDRTTIEFAKLMAREFGGFQPPPAYAG